MFKIHPLQVYLVMFDYVKGVVSGPQLTWDIYHDQALVWVMTKFVSDSSVHDQLGVHKVMSSSVSFMGV